MNGTKRSHQADLRRPQKAASALFWVVLTATAGVLKSNLYQDINIASLHYITCTDDFNGRRTEFLSQVFLTLYERKITWITFGEFVRTV
jgi:hypothetical protein